MLILFRGKSRPSCRFLQVPKNYGLDKLLPSANEVPTMAAKGCLLLPFALT
jgi:hypothetical protein